MADGGVAAGAHPDPRHRPAQPAGHPADRRGGAVRGPRLPFGAVGRGHRARRQAGRGDRQRPVLRPDRAGDRARRSTRLVVFQRTPNWFYPRGDRPYGRLERFLFRHLPGYARLHRAFIYLQRESLYLGFRQGSFAARFLDRHGSARCWSGGRGSGAPGAADARLPARVQAHHRLRRFPADAGSARMSTLETDAIARITPTGIVTESGAEPRGRRHRLRHRLQEHRVRRADRGHRRGRREPAGALGGRRRGLLRHHRRRLSQHVHPLWPQHQSRPQFDHLHGRAAGRPHDAPGRDPVRRGLRSIAVRPAAMAAYNEALQAELGSSVWKTGCRNWYMTERGKITNNWPHSTIAWRKRTRGIDLGDFELVPAEQDSYLSTIRSPLISTVPIWLEHVLAEQRDAGAPRRPRRGLRAPRGRRTTGGRWSPE